MINGRRKQTIKMQAVIQPITGKGVSSLSNSPSGGQAQAKNESPVADIDQRSIFIQTLQAVECSPREAAETIADLFFSGNINDPKWLKRVLTQDAAGCIPPRRWQQPSPACVGLPPPDPPHQVLEGQASIGRSATPL